MIQVYTGDGKGKTTAALGLILRASGAGMKIYFGQFIKSRDTSEGRAIAAAFPNVTHEAYGGGFVLGEATAEQRAAAAEGLRRAQAAVCSGAYDLIVLDEFNVAVNLGLIDSADALALLQACPATRELVITGRGASQALMDAADLVTEMGCVKHYYEKGVQARAGIEH